MSKKINVTTIITFLFATFILGFNVNYGSSPEAIEKSFSVEKGGTLSIDSELGAIRVNSSTANTVEVKVIPESGWLSGSKNIFDNFEVNFAQTGNNVSVTGKFRNPSHKNWNGPGLRYEVTVPYQYNVDLKTSGGSISVGKLQGAAAAKTSGGSLQFGEIDGEVTGKTSGGSITVDGCAKNTNVNTSGGSINLGAIGGNVDANTSGGSIKIEKAGGNVIAATSGGSINVGEVMGTIDARTSGGSVTAKIKKQPENACRLKTSGGSVTCYLPDNAAVDLDAETSSGRVESDFDVTVKGKMEEHSLLGKINGGGPELLLRTSGGNIRLLKL
ncbi:MAG: DUF4097 family beta strand repeat-containing protein [Calditrichia bacterium]